MNVIEIDKSILTLIALIYPTAVLRKKNPIYLPEISVNSLQHHIFIDIL